MKDIALYTHKYKKRGRIIMPSPIVPMHSLTAHEGLFGGNNDAPITEGLSDIQALMLGLPQKTAATKYEPRVLDILEKINKHEDELITTAANIKMKDGEKYYRVPSEINDNDILSLKVAGLITGNSRTIKFTEKGVVALRSKWLNESNNYRANRTKNKFDIRNASKNQRYNSRFTRIAEDSTEDHSGSRAHLSKSQAYLFPDKETGTWWVEYFKNFNAEPIVKETNIPIEWDGELAVEMFSGAHPEIYIVDFFPTKAAWIKEVNEWARSEME